MKPLIRLPNGAWVRPEVVTQIIPAMASDDFPSIGDRVIVHTANGSIHVYDCDDPRQEADRMAAIVRGVELAWVEGR